MELYDDIATLKGIGKQRETKLNSMGIYTVKDLLMHYPRDYKDRSQLVKISELALEEESTFLGYCKEYGDLKQTGRFQFVRVKVFDETGMVTLLWFNQPYMKKALVPRQWYLFTGKLQKKYGKQEVAVVDYEKIGDNFAGGRIIPVYASVKGISQKMLRTYVEDILQTMQEMALLQEELPEWVREECHLPEKNFSLLEIHFPKTEEGFYEARKRLVFEEFFLLQTALYSLKSVFEKNTTAKVMQHEEAIQEMIEKLPFPLTNAQKKVLKEMQGDMTTGKQMNRLVQGDVGSGKTAVAMVLAYWVIQNGHQVVLMAPTEVLAQQHFASFYESFTSLGIPVALLFSGQKAKERRESLEGIASGRYKMIIGTHALVQEKVIYNDLALAITDEQHRFGVKQRAILSEKGEAPHVLVMTATPIPRTLALMIYGELDISIIDELPLGRKAIETWAVNVSYRERIYTFIEKQVGEGRQAYVICPMIEENEKLEVESVLDYTEKLQDRLSGISVAYVHGKMKPQEKQTIMTSFANNEIQVLVSTTVIEVGINVPNASVMLVENAERFGLSQLHQLRGRVGRGEYQSYCILVSEAKSKTTKKRLEALVKSQDGFYISEVDLNLRGPGEFFGTMQHGLPEFKIANIYKDMEILKEAQKMARKFVEPEEESQKKGNELWEKAIDNYLKHKILEI
ncbi:MAG: ATP-dependent DNA helicase RecG [Bacillota bacterium]